MIPFDVLATPPTADEVLEEFRASLESYGVPARSWGKDGPSGTGGGVANTILVVIATVFAAFATIVSAIAVGGFLDYATGDGLTLLARYVFGVERIPATQATGQVKLTNSGGGIYTYAVGEFRVLNPTTGKGYVNASAFTLAALSTLSIDVISEEFGTAASSSAGTITKLDTTALGVSCTNPLAVVGTDAESDPRLAQRCRDRRDAYGVGGPRGAYAYWGISAKRIDGSAVNINRVSVSTSSSTGQVYVYLAAPSGAPSAGDVTAAALAFETYVRPDSVTVTTAAAVVRTVPVTATIWADPTVSTDTAALSAAALAALIALQSTWPIGGIRKGDGTTNGLFSDRINAALIASHPAIFDADGVTSDVPLLANEIPVFVPTLTVAYGVRG